MRKYQPIWDLLKKDKIASLIAPIDSHKTIIKMVIKEKYKDIGWKLLLSEKGMRYRLAHKIAGSKITFELIENSPAHIEML